MQARTQVLVVGAGPVGLMAALELTHQGVAVRIVDRSQQPRSFAVVLHPRTVAMLAKMGIVEPLLWQGHSFTRAAIFADGERQAVLKLPLDGELTHGALTLPQDVLRTVLEGALRSAGVKVEYGAELVAFDQDSEAVRCRLAKPVTSTTAEVQPALGAGSSDVVAEFVIGADGHQSALRQILGIPLLPLSKPRHFAFFDVPHAPPVGATAELAFGEYSSAMYPLHGGTTRYSFELPAARSGALGAGELIDLRRKRMPWHPSSVESVSWSGDRTFQAALAERFGRNRVWLAGDAGHIAYPLGAQSLNVGLREATELTNAIVDCLDGGRLEALSNGYAEQRLREWRRLLNVEEEQRFGARAPAWAVRHFEQLTSCLPASGHDLDALLAQLDISFE